MYSILKKSITFLTFLLYILSGSSTLFAQSSGNTYIDVFLDCNGCDITYTRQKINYVNYVIDQQLAQVHIFVTQQQTGSGSQQYELNFMGKKDYDGLDYTLSFTSPQTDTWDERRSGLIEILKVGLVPYLNRTELAQKIKVSIELPETDETNNADKKDPWNSWIFELYANGNFDKESARTILNYRYGLQADRITEDWRFRSRIYFNTNEQTFEQDGETRTSNRYRNGGFASLVKSLGDHWSAGMSGSINRDTYRNMDMSMSISPAFEYSFFPYTEVMKKEFTLAYRVNVIQNNYIEETVFFQTQELLTRQSLDLSIRIRQPWGSIFAGAEASHYFHDPSKNRLEMDSFINIRVFKGLALRLNGELNFIRDQLYLPVGETTLEDILLQQTQVATDYEMYVGLGLSYTFGSMYNNIINTRL
jgi:hypothetical protein